VLELLSEDDAILFLLKRTKLLALDSSLTDASNHDIEAARALTQLLGYLPLALDQAAGYILETQSSFVEYLALFQTYQDRLLQRRIGEGIPTDHPQSVTATFQINFQHVQRRSTAAADLLCLCALSPPWLIFVALTSRTCHENAGETCSNNSFVPLRSMPRK
jgi:hypothetical protein